MQPIFLVNEIFPAYAIFQEDFSLEQIADKFAYIIDADGWKILKRNGVSTALIRVGAVSGLATLEQNISFTATRIPLDLIRKVAAYFKAIYQKYQSEASGYLYYQPETREWDFVPPTQTVGHLSVKYDAAPKRQGWVVAGTIHSHSAIGSGHSGIDDRDEKHFDGVHITIGHVNTIPDYSCSIVVHGHRTVVDPSVLVDGFAPQDEVPAEWIMAVKESKPSGFDPSFQPRADKIYEIYYAGKMSENEYKQLLAQLKENQETARQRAKENFSLGSFAQSGHATFTPQHHGKKGKKHHGR